MPNRPHEPRRSRSGGNVPTSSAVVGRSGEPRRTRDGRSGRPDGRSGGVSSRPPQVVQGYGDAGVRNSQLYPKGASYKPVPTNHA